ncbi:MAG TPA: nuclear transport factor 2 family protein [Nevskiaceae bacterium]|nr:nuclear transport factor 2 family protein [Nevskiaceae bacterium]
MHAVERLQAHIDISNLLARYTYAIDGGDFAAQAALFEHAVVVAGGRERRGAAAFRAMEESFVRIYEDGTPRTKHLLSNLVIDVAPSGTTGQSRCYVVVLQATDQLPLQPICAGRYEDQFERVDDVWRFSRREMHINLVGDFSAHLLKPADG